MATWPRRASLRCGTTKPSAAPGSCSKRAARPTSSSGESVMADQLELTRSEDRLQTVNPATEEPGRSYEQHSLDEARGAAAAAHRAFLDWRRTSFAERSAVLHKAAEG